MPFSFTQWRYETPYQAPAGPIVGPEPFFRDRLDALRSMYRRTPDAEYPDGYLGTIQSRHEDRLIDAVKESRLTQKNYQRGVHKGERIDPQDYLWPARLHPELGIQLEARGKKFAPAGSIDEVLVAEGKFPGPQGAGGVLTLDPKRASQLRHLAPSWNP